MYYCTIYQSYCVELVYDQETMAFEMKKKRKMNTPQKIVQQQEQQKKLQDKGKTKNRKHRIKTDNKNSFQIV